MTGMDLDRLAGVEPAVDAAVVEDELRRYLDGEHPPESHGPWTIETVGQADWAMQAVAECDRRAQSYQDEIDLWQAARKRVAAGGAWLRERLEEWALAQRTDKVKTFPLAHGTVGTRASKPAIVVVDEDAAIAWAEQHAPDAVKVTKELLKSQLGDAARIAEVIVAYEAINTLTGDVERVPTPVPAIFDAAKFERLRVRLGSDYSVQPIMGLAVLDAEDLPVPGLDVRPERVTATVTPLWK